MVCFSLASISRVEIAQHIMKKKNQFVFHLNLKIKIVFFEKNKILGILILPILIWNGIKVSSYFFMPYIEADKDIKIAQEIKEEKKKKKKIIYLKRYLIDA